MFYPMPRRNVIKRDHATQTTPATERLCSMPATVSLAEKMGTLLGRGALLQ